MTTVKPWESRVLVHAPIGRDGAASAALLRRSNLEVEVCANIDELLARAAEGAGTICVTEEGLFGKNLTTIGDWAAMQPAWSDMPFVVFTSRLLQPAVVEWRKRMVVALRNVSLLERPVQSITLTTTVQSAIRARMRQLEVRALLLAQDRAASVLENTVRTRTQELREANAELRSQMKERAIVEETLRHAQKMEALGQLTGGVAHDFNNLLMVISGGLQMFERHDDPVRRTRLMRAMLQAVERGAGLTRQLLAFSRRQSLQAEPIDLLRQIKGMREMLERSLSGDIAVELHLPDAVWVVEVDPGELELVLLNLAVNARDAMPSGGTISIQVQEMPGLTVQELHGDFVSVSVTDSGVGMTDAVKARVFEPFFTTKDVGKGSGLGLAQAYGFAKQSGGIVDITSEVGVGTTVRLILPRSFKPLPNKQAPAGQRESAAALSAHVLLVEDDNEVAAMVSAMIEELGFRATRVDNPNAALGMLADGKNVDIVLSDIMMPGGMSGVELAREIRARRIRVPVILTSGYVGPEARAAESDGIPLLPKPFDVRELGTRLATALAGSENRQEPGMSSVG